MAEDSNANRAGEIQGTPEEIARSMRDCRFCRHYSFDRDIEIETFDCSLGYFHFVDYGGGRENEGAMKWYGCDGEDFVFFASPWWKAVYASLKGERVPEPVRESEPISSPSSRDNPFGIWFHNGSICYGFYDDFIDSELPDSRD